MNKLYIILLAMCVATFTSCANHATEEHEHEHEEEHEHEHEGHAHSDEIVLTPEKAQAAGVETDTLRPAAFSEVIHASGQLIASQGEEQTIVAPVAGIVHFHSQLTEGASVARGASICSLSSKGMAEGNPVERARIAYETAKQEYDRVKSLSDEQIVSQKEFAQVKQEYENARDIYDNLKAGSSAKGQQVTSPLAGFIKQLLVKEGDYVQMGQPLATITQSRRLTLKAEVSARYFSELSLIRNAHFATPYNNKVYDLKELNGRLLTYGKSLSDGSNYIPVAFELDNRGDLVPGEFVDVYLQGQQIPDVLAVPVTALVEEQGTYSVFIQIDEDGYRKQPVEIGRNDGLMVEITSGLQTGQMIVTKGAIHVKLASASNAIPAHTHNH